MSESEENTTMKTGLEYIGFIDPWTEEECLTNEEIVRCKDCRSSYIYDGEKWPGKKYKGRMYCIAWSDGYMGEWVNPNGFCYKGKRQK